MQRGLRTAHFGLRAAGWAKHRGWTGGAYPPPHLAGGTRARSVPGRGWHVPRPGPTAAVLSCLTHGFPRGAQRCWPRKLPIWGDISTHQRRRTSAPPTRPHLHSPGPKSLLTALESLNHLSWLQVSSFAQSRTAVENTGAYWLRPRRGTRRLGPTSTFTRTSGFANSGSATQYCHHSRHAGV